MGVLERFVVQKAVDICYYSAATLLSEFFTCNEEENYSMERPKMGAKLQFLDDTVNSFTGLWHCFF